MRIGDVPIGSGAPLALIAGINVIEDELETIECARGLQALAQRHDLPLIFKASYDKANRSQVGAYRGPGIDEGLHVLSEVKRETGLPLITDVHEPGDAKVASSIVDCLQVPAYLCRQTDLVVACAKTGLPVNIKKGQFLAPQDAEQAIAKVRANGTGGAMITERGTTFGYNNLVVDMRSLVQMRNFAPVCFDATHAVQHPGAADGASGGDRRFVPSLARAAVAVGIDCLFVEAHPDPEAAPCDGPSQINFASLDAMLLQVRSIDSALRQKDGTIPESNPR